MSCACLPLVEACFTAWACSVPDAVCDDTATSVDPSLDCLKRPSVWIAELIACMAHTQLASTILTLQSEFCTLYEDV